MAKSRGINKHQYIKQFNWAVLQKLKYWSKHIQNV